MYNIETVKVLWQINNIFAEKVNACLNEMSIQSPNWESSSYFKLEAKVKAYRDCMVVITKASIDKSIQCFT